MFRGSLREDFIDRRERSWRGRVEAATGWAAVAVVAVEMISDGLIRIKKIENAIVGRGKRFMALRLWCGARND